MEVVRQNKVLVWLNVWGEFNLKTKVGMDVSIRKKIIALLQGGLLPLP